MKRRTSIAIAVFLVSIVVLASPYAYAQCVACAGSVTPEEAYTMVAEYSNVYILDVRTEAEWKWVGHPGANKQGEGEILDGKVVNISYKIEEAGSFIVNPSFITDVEELFDESVVLITMCRSGKRGAAAAEALNAVGYQNVYNMLTGFEGGKDAYGYRTVNGWAVDGLPYTYSGAGYQD